MLAMESFAMIHDALMECIYVMKMLFVNQLIVSSQVFPKLESIIQWYAGKRPPLTGAKTLSERPKAGEDVSSD